MLIQTATLSRNEEKAKCFKSFDPKNWHVYVKFFKFTKSRGPELFLNLQLHWQWLFDCQSLTAHACLFVHALKLHAVFFLFKNVDSDSFIVFYCIIARLILVKADRYFYLWNISLKGTYMLVLHYWYITRPYLQSHFPIWISKHGRQNELFQGGLLTYKLNRVTRG